MSKDQVLSDASFIALVIFVVHVLYLKIRELIAMILEDLCSTLREALKLFREFWSNDPPEGGASDASAPAPLVRDDPGAEDP